MANRTAKDAKSIKGTNPQYLVEKIIRTRIYDSQYWKESCFGLTAELLVDRAMELDHIGGHYSGNIKPTPFLCLVLKMLQIQPTKDIVIEFIKNPDYKYVRALGAMYLRLVGDTIECYNYLEPLYNDYRKLKSKNRSGEIELIHVDEFVDDLLHKERCCDIILPRIQKRYVLEQNEELEPRVSALDDDLSGIDSEEEDDAGNSPPPADRRSPSPSRHDHERRGRDKDRDRRSRRRSRSRSHSPRRRRSHSPRHERKRSRSHSPLASHHREKTRAEKASSKSSSHKKEKKESKKKLTAEEEEIRQANELRAKLGLQPLRV